MDLTNDDNANAMTMESTENYLVGKEQDDIRNPPLDEVEENQIDGEERIDKEGIFVKNVRQYLQLHDEITEKSRALAAIRKQKQDLKDYIIHYMKVNNVEQCVSDDGKLYIARTKSSQPINKDYIFSTLSSEIGVETAEKLVEVLWTSREVTMKETLRRTKAKN
jgi:Family of unknown function (DUF5760)